MAHPASATEMMRGITDAARPDRFVHGNRPGVSRENNGADAAMRQTYMGMVLITITPLVGEHRESSRPWGQMTRHESGTFPHRISPDIAQRRFAQ